MKFRHLRYGCANPAQQNRRRSVDEAELHEAPAISDGKPAGRHIARGSSMRASSVRGLPKEYQFETNEVIRKVGDDVILSPRPRDWRTYLEPPQSPPTHSWPRSRICPCRSARPARRVKDGAALAAFLPNVEVMECNDDAALHT
jgi:virulence-associated protein VagC